MARERPHRGPDQACRNYAPAARPESGAPSRDPENIRGPDGRFREGCCGNRKGRPPKPKVSLNEVLLSVLEQGVTVPGQNAQISLYEAIARTLAGEALKDPRIALALLKLLPTERTEVPEFNEAAGLITEEDAALDRYLAREVRRARKRKSDDGRNSGGAT